MTRERVCTVLSPVPWYTCLSKNSQNLLLLKQNKDLRPTVNNFVNTGTTSWREIYTLIFRSVVLTFAFGGGVVTRLVA